MKGFQSRANVPMFVNKSVDLHLQVEKRLV